MADSPGKPTPSTDPKSPDKTGPVRPPVLEGTARSASGGKPAEASTAGKTTSTTASKPDPAKASTPRPKPPEPAPSGGSPWLAGVLGGAIGLGAAYGLAWFGLWPNAPQTPPPADPRLAQFGTAIPELQGTTGTLQSDIAALGNRLGTLETDIAALPTASAPASDTDLSGQVAELAAQVQALSMSAAPAADSAETGGNAETIAALEAQLAELRQATGDNANRLAETESQLAALIEAANESVATGNQAARLPLIFSTLESAFASGRPYEAELAALRQTWPDADVPDSVTVHAADGLPRPDAVAQRLAAAIPDMLAGRPINAGADWQDGAIDWMRGIVAMRPAGEIEGDGPEAQIARLEAAIARRDYAAAQAALSALPEGMQDAAGPIAADIAALASAESFLAELRSTALNAESGV
jgi:hypothetical protein